MSRQLKSKSPAEFFAEHQNIAGFDNPGKSLYTTVREFVENSLDAAESIGVLPSIRLSIEQVDQDSLNELRGYKSRKRKDLSLYESGGSKKRKKCSNGLAIDTGNDGSLKQNPKKSSGKKASSSDKRNVAYFRVTCQDNGIGMPHAKIPSMLGIVLSSTKYGVKQTRGKFGLGAKMALVWAKKSTGMPVEVETAQEGKRISACRLDIDIHKNEPRVLLHEKRPNPEAWRGTKISVVISGNWTNYRSKIINYLRQLAVITPYANFEFSFKSSGDDRRSVEMEFARRSDKCPPPPKEVRHHPSSVDNLVMESLIANSRPNLTLQKFLTTKLSCITTKLATRLIEELGPKFEYDCHVGDLTKKQIQQLTSLMREAKFPKPSGSCLSPAGEYNLRLGILKELKPDVVSTYSEKVSIHEGHPFIVEAAVSLGGDIAKPGINVHRYANRIPLLFEQGNDITTQIANKKIRWASYKIKSTDKVGVFVSIVSTKIPFKGTSKEYIGDDNGPLHAAVKHALSQCGVQLRKELVKKNALKDQADRKKALTKYIPDVGRALVQALKSMSGEGGNAAFGSRPRHPEFIKDSALREAGDEIMRKEQEGELTLKVLTSKLAGHVQRIDKALALEFATEQGRNSKKLDALYICPFRGKLAKGVTSCDAFSFKLWA